jgi:hypothetical protein
MANYHLSIKIFSRGKGASAVAKAAYRAAERIRNEYDGETHDYTRKMGIIHKEILLPDHAPPEYSDRAILWNAVEKLERYKTAQLAREVEISLPVELTHEQNIALARQFTKEVFVAVGMCADVCVHNKSDGNPHAHIMLTMRPIEQDGCWGQKSHTVNGKKIPTVDWNEQERAEDWRKAWAEYCNTALRENGHNAVLDHRSYARQDIDKVPTIHTGVAAVRIERKGIRTERGDINRAIAITNREYRQVRARIHKLKNWLYKQPINAPSMGEMMNAITRGLNFKSRWKTISDLKTAARVLIFIQRNGFSGDDSVVKLADKITELYQRQFDLGGEIKGKERRISKLNEHLSHVDAYNEHRAVFKKYKQLDLKKRGAYKEKHAGAISKYEIALDYLKAHLNGREQIPEKAWRAERENLLNERYVLVDEFYTLKEDVRIVEVLQRGAENIMQEITPERTVAREKIMEL